MEKLNYDHIPYSTSIRSSSSTFGDGTTWGHALGAALPPAHTGRKCHRRHAEADLPPQWHHGLEVEMVMALGRQRTQRPPFGQKIPWGARERLAQRP